MDMEPQKSCLLMYTINETIHEVFFNLMPSFYFLFDEKQNN